MRCLKMRIGILDKMSYGVSYFITMYIFNVAYAKQVIEDLVHTCKRAATIANNHFYAFGLWLAENAEVYGMAGYSYT